MKAACGSPHFPTGRIGWDGAHRDRVKELLAKDELPTLAALVKQGKLVDVDVVTGATDTKAGWTQISLGEAAPERKAPTENPNPRPGLARHTVSQG